jgi:hypothetical protein
MAQNDAPVPQDVQQTPPAPQIEVAPTLSDPQSEIWLPGYWAYNGATFHWVEGKVIHRPSPTAVWAASRWTQHSYGWSFEKGHWE